MPEQTDADYPLRTYEITWWSGRRETLQATQVNMSRESFTDRPGVVEFYGPLDRGKGKGRCGRLLLAARLGTDITQIRDRGADIAQVWTAEVTVVKPTFWSRLLDAMAFRR